jgi:hypothetical protein
VFDAAGKCILTLHSPESMERSHGGAGSSKGKKQSATPLQKARAPGKKRRLAIEDSEQDGDSVDEPLVLQKGRSHPPDQSMEGEFFIIPNTTQN